MDIQGNIRVICRVRPILEVERKSGIFQMKFVNFFPPNLYIWNVGEGVDATEILSDEDIVIHRDQSTKNK